jgi:hypothetical protein
VEIRFDLQKDELLRARRGICFHDVIVAIAERGVLLDFEHPDQTKYPGQRVMVVEINRYACCVPYEMDGQTMLLKTVYPNRKFKYLVEGEPNGEIQS